MKILMKTTSAGPTGVMHAGREYDLPDAEARDIIACGAGTPVDRGTKVSRAERAVGTDAPPAKPAAKPEKAESTRTGPASKQARVGPS